MISAKNAAIALAVIVAAIFSYFQINEYFQHRSLITQQRTTIQKSIAESTEATGDILNLEINPNSTTYAELFERGDDRVKKISDAIIPIGISSLPQDERAPLKKYMQGLQEMLRLEIAEKRKEIAASTTLDQAKTQLEEYKNSTNLYSRDFERQRTQKAIADSGTAVKEQAEALKAFVESVRKFRKLMDVLRPALNDYSLLDDQLLSDLLSKSDSKKS